MASAAAAGPHDLLIVGPGVLGTYAGKLWLERHPSSLVVGQTNTTNNHARLKAVGMTPRVKDDASAEQQFANVLFAAPPSGSADYVGEVKAALQMWNGVGTFVFTSSAGVYAMDGFETTCVEDSAVTRGNDRTDKLLAAEDAVLQAGGCVVRLVGLYHANRGAHTFFLKQVEVNRWSGYTVNLLHYEDAASLAVAVMDGAGDGAPHRSRLFLGCDDQPITFQEMMEATVASERFKDMPFKFTGAQGGSVGKRVDNSATRAALGGWTPRYRSFAEFMRNGASDFYTTSGLF